MFRHTHELLALLVSLPVELAVQCHSAAGSGSSCSNSSCHAYIHLRGRTVCFQHVQTNNATVEQPIMLEKSRALGAPLSAAAIGDDSKRAARGNCRQGVLELLLHVRSDKTALGLAYIRSQLEINGMRVISFLPDDAFLVHAPCDHPLPATGHLHDWIAPYSPQYKLSPAAERFCKHGRRVSKLFEVHLRRLHNSMQRTMSSCSCLRTSLFHSELLQHRRFDHVVCIGERTLHIRFLPGGRCLPLLLRLAARTEVAWVDVEHHFRAANAVASRIVQAAEFVNASAKGVATLSQRVARTLAWNHGITGNGQIIGMGDSGLNVSSCFLRDLHHKVPLNHINHEHRKVVAYFTSRGDDTDHTGHGTHIAGSAVGFADGVDEGTGMAPGAKLAFVDLGVPWDNGRFHVPRDIASQYFDILHGAGASIVASAWGAASDGLLQIDVDVDSYLWRNLHGAVLPLFPSGNSGGVGHVDSPCRSKSSLCVGATYNGREVYLKQPFAQTSVIVLEPFKVLECSRWQRVTEISWQSGTWPLGPDCGSVEISGVPAVFGPTRRLPCHDEACPYDAHILGSIQNAVLAVADPLDLCTAHTSVLALAIVLVAMRGGCSFVQKAYNAENAGASGLIIVNNEPPRTNGFVEMSGPLEADVSIVTVLIQQEAGRKLLAVLSNPSIQPELGATFPLQSSKLSPWHRASFSAHGPLSDGRVKPEVMAPGHRIASASSSAECQLRLDSGTSHAVPFVAGAAALILEYLGKGYVPSGLPVRTDEWVHPTPATVRGLLISSAWHEGKAPDRVWTPDMGFGLVQLERLLAFRTPGATAMERLQSLQIVEAQLHGEGWSAAHRFCFQWQPGLAMNDSSSNSPSSKERVSGTVTLAWSDFPAEPSARLPLVNNLDLFVSCDEELERPLWGNGGASADDANTLEQVVLPLPHGARRKQPIFCQAWVRASRMPEAPQPYSLIFSGPGMAMRPTCSPSGDSALRCGSQRKWQPNSTCTCQWPWVGFACDLVPLPVGAGTLPCPASQLDILTAKWLSSHPAAAPYAHANLRSLQPHQWLVFAFRLCRTPGTAVTHTFSLRASRETFEVAALANPIRIAASTNITGLQALAMSLMPERMNDTGISYVTKSGLSSQVVGTTGLGTHNSSWFWHLEALVDGPALAPGVEFVFVVLQSAAVHSQLGYTIEFAYSDSLACNAEFGIPNDNDNLRAGHAADTTHRAQVAYSVVIAVVLCIIM